MKAQSIFQLFAVCSTLFAVSQANAASCEAEVLPKIEGALKGTSVEAGVASAARSLMSEPRFFEDASSGAVCTRPKMDHPRYPAIPVMECTYQRLGLPGWVMVANPGADTITKWVAAACAETGNPSTCAARVTTHVWCSSQFVFPVAGNLIQPRLSNGGRTGMNTAYVNGAPIAQPSWLPAGAPVSAAVQKERFSALALSEKTGEVLPDRAAWPAGVSPATYARFTGASKAVGGGDACAVATWRQRWGDLTRAAYNQGWRNGRNPMFDIAAKSLMANAKPDAQLCG